MALRIILIILVILLALVIVLPFVLNIAGFKLLQFGSVGGGVGREGAPVILRSQNGGEDWENVSVSEHEREEFPSRILHFAFHPANPDTLFIGTRGSGLWKSANGGTFWSKVSDRAGVLDPQSDVHKIAIARRDPNVMYLAVSQDRRGRVLRSNDGGESFQEIYFVSADGNAVFDLHGDPFDLDHLIIATEQGGILETSNGGKSWRVAHWFATGIRRILVNPNFSREILAISENGELFKSVDGGTHWADLNESAQVSEGQFVYPPPEARQNFSFFGSFSGSQIRALVPDSNNFAILYQGSSEGLLRSIDGGFSWERLNVLIPPEALPVDAVALHPESSRVIFASAGTQMHRSQDGGVNWNMKILPSAGRIHTIAINPLKPEIMFAVSQ